MAYFRPWSAWQPGSAEVDGNLESNHPTWVMWARRGPRHQRIYLASGPLATKPVAEQIATVLNRQDPARWDHFIQVHLPQQLRYWG